MKSLEQLKMNSLRHRLAMARNYDAPERYLSEEEMPLYEAELEAYRKRFDHLDLSGPYRPEQVEGRWYVVGHNDVSEPTYDFQACLRLLVQKEQALSA